MLEVTQTAISSGISGSGVKQPLFQLLVLVFADEVSLILLQFGLNIMMDGLGRLTCIGLPIRNFVGERPDVLAGLVSPSAAISLPLLHILCFGESVDCAGSWVGIRSSLH